MQEERRRKNQASSEKIKNIGNGEAPRPRNGYSVTNLVWQQQQRLISDASRQPGELYCMFGSSQRNMQKLAGSRKGIEQHGVANNGGTDERIPARTNYYNTTTRLEANESMQKCHCQPSQCACKKPSEGWRAQS